MRGRRKDFSRGGGTGEFFQKFSRGAKSGEISFLPLEPKKITLLLKFSKSRGGSAFLSDAHMSM